MGSTAEVTVGGTYTGSTDDTLSFEVFRDRTVGDSRRLKLDVYDGAGNYLERITWDRSSPEGSIETTSLGLELSFGAGDLSQYDTFHVDVFASTGTDAVASNPLDGVRDAHPQLEDAEAVTDGEFILNGEIISVSRADSIEDVLNRISASAAGVTASLAGDVVTLTADRAGEEISLTSDTSGLIAALKLDTSIATPATLDEETMSMSDVAALAGVTDGTFEINGETISVSAADSIEDVLNRISASAAGVTASLTSGGAVQIVSDSEEAFVLSGDTSGFLSTVGIEQDTYSSTVEEPSKRGSRLAARMITEALQDLADPLNELFATSEDDDPIRLDRISMHSRLKAAIRSAFDESDLDADSNDIGLEFDTEADEDTLLLDLSLSNRRTLQNAMRQGPREMTRLLFGSQSQEGFLSRLTDAVELAREDIREQSGGIAVALSTYI